MGAFVQMVGALDAARDLTVAHTRERDQFGRPLTKFQAVQRSLAEMAGEIERARAATSWPSPPRPTTDSTAQQTSTR